MKGTIKLLECLNPFSSVTEKGMDFLCIQKLPFIMMLA